MKRMIPLFCVLFLITRAVSAGPSQNPAYNNIKTVNRSFSPGEKLTYEISWSKIVQAGIAVMEVREGKTRDNRPAYDLVSHTYSVGMVDKFYPVRDTVQSLVDAEEFSSVSFSLRSSRGKRKKERDMVFDPEKGTVRVTVNGESQVYSVPERVQDALSSLYYLRTRKDFVVGKPIVVDVHDSGKTWAVEIQTLGRERITTPAGEFDTIKITDTSKIRRRIHEPGGDFHLAHGRRSEDPGAHAEHDFHRLHRSNAYGDTGQKRQPMIAKKEQKRLAGCHRSVFQDPHPCRRRHRARPLHLGQGVPHLPGGAGPRG